MATTFPVEAGALTKVPLHNASRNAKNWMAVIQHDQNAPGGLHRSFFERARGDGLFYLTKRMEVGQPIEFGADVTVSGEVKRTRWYGVIEDIMAGGVSIEQYADARRAIEAASLLRGTLMAAVEGGDRRRRQLESEKAQLLERIGQIDRELAAIEKAGGAP